MVKYWLKYCVNYLSKLKIMRNSLFIIFILSIITLRLYAQENISNNTFYKNTFKFSPVHFFLSTLQMGYERALDNKNNLCIGAGITSSSNWNTDERSGVNAEMLFKHFVFTNAGINAAQRLYFAPYVQYRYTEGEYEYWNNIGGIVYNEKKTEYINSYGGGIVFGFKMIIVKRLVFDVYLGGGIRITDDKDNHWDGIMEPGYNGIAPKFGLDIGFGF